MTKEKLEKLAIKRHGPKAATMPEVLWKRYQASGFEPGLKPMFYQGYWRTWGQVGALNGSKKGTSGIDKRGHRFRVRVMVHGKSYTVGTFATEEEAIKARAEWKGPEFQRPTPAAAVGVAQKAALMELLKTVSPETIAKCLEILKSSSLDEELKDIPEAPKPFDWGA